LINSSQSHPTHSLSPPSNPNLQTNFIKKTPSNHIKTHSSLTLSPPPSSYPKLKWPPTLSITPSTTIPSSNATTTTTPQTPLPPPHFSSHPPHTPT